MSQPARHQPLSDLYQGGEWMSEAFPPLRGWRTMNLQGIRVETYVDGDDYVVRAELPGIIDPDKDLQATVHRGVLTIRADRSEEKVDKNHSEFRYGSFARSIRLPEGASEDNVRAAYHDGILTVRVGMDIPSMKAKKITIARGPFDEPEPQ